VRVPGVEPFPDLVGRDFRPAEPNRVWCADIKQTMTGEGWLYLAAVQDLFSRRIVGWSMAAHMRQEAGHRRAHDGFGGPQARDRDDSSLRPRRAAQVQPVLATPP